MTHRKVFLPSKQPSQVLWSCSEELSFPVQTFKVHVHVLNYHWSKHCPNRFWPYWALTFMMESVMCSSVGQYYNFYGRFICSIVHVPWPVFFFKEKKKKKTKYYHFLLKESLVFITKAYKSDNVILCVNTQLITLLVSIFDAIADLRGHTNSPCLSPSPLWNPSGIPYYTKRTTTATIALLLCIFSTYCLFVFVLFFKSWTCHFFDLSWITSCYWSDYAHSSL